MPGTVSCPVRIAPIKLIVTTNNDDVVVNYEIGHTTQTDLEQWRANIYEISVDTAFTKSALINGSIELSILGSDLWVPGNIWLFGIDSIASTPTKMIVLSRVYLPGPMSQEKVYLPCNWVC